jgi:hypothetical protein
MTPTDSSLSANVSVLGVHNTSAFKCVIYHHCVTTIYLRSSIFAMLHGVGLYLATAILWQLIAPISKGVSRSTKHGLLALRRRHYYIARKCRKSNYLFSSRRVTSQKSQDLKYTAAEAWNHACFTVPSCKLWMYPRIEFTTTLLV